MLTLRNRREQISREGSGGHLREPPPELSCENPQKILTRALSYRGIPFENNLKIKESVWEKALKGVWGTNRKVPHVSFVTISFCKRKDRIIILRNETNRGILC